MSTIISLYVGVVRDAMTNEPDLHAVFCAVVEGAGNKGRKVPFIRTSSIRSSFVQELLKPKPEDKELCERRRNELGLTPKSLQDAFDGLVKVRSLIASNQLPVLRIPTMLNFLDAIGRMKEKRLSGPEAPRA